MTYNAWKWTDAVLSARWSSGDKLPAGEKVALLALQRFADAAGVCQYPSLRDIADHCGVARSGVGSALRHGVELGLVRRIARPGYATEYRLLMGVRA